MSHEAIMYGVIVGATRRPGDDFLSLHPLNVEVIGALPKDNDHPWVDNSIFALPGEHPHGTFRRQAIHFGLSIKDDPYDLDGFLVSWINKFENVLKKLYWVSVRLHVDRDFGSCEYEWTASEQARVGLLADPPSPTTQWNREFRAIGKRKLHGT